MSSRGETICHLTDSYSGYFLVIAGIFLSLHQLGASTTELALVAGGVGVIIGVGGESIVTDMLSGVLMTFEGEVHAGDMVFYEGNRNYVISIGVRTTRLMMYGKTTVVRNNDFKNYNTIPVNARITVNVSFRVNLSESIEQIEEIIARELPVIHEKFSRKWDDVEGPFYWGVSEISDSWMEFATYMTCGGEYYTAAEVQLKAELKMMCDRNHIRPAMPQVVVHEADRSDQ